MFSVLFGCFFLVLAVVKFFTRIDPVTVDVDWLAQMRDVARVFLTAHSTLHQSLLREMIHFCNHGSVVITKWTGERRVDLRCDLLRGRLARLALPLVKLEEQKHRWCQKTILGNRVGQVDARGRAVICTTRWEPSGYNREQKVRKKQARTKGAHHDQLRDVGHSSDVQQYNPAHVNVSLKPPVFFYRFVVRLATLGCTALGAARIVRYYTSSRSIHGLKSRYRIHRSCTKFSSFPATHERLQQKTGTNFSPVVPEIIVFSWYR